MSTFGGEAGAAIGPVGGGLADQADWSTNFSSGCPMALSRPPHSAPVTRATLTVTARAMSCETAWPSSLHDPLSLQSSLISRNTKETSPPSTDGMPCRLWTPQLSCSPFSSSAGCSLMKPSDEIRPARQPTPRAPVGDSKKLAVAPTVTPPASVAFWISTGRMLLSSHAEMPNVVTVLPSKANTVLSRPVVSCMLSPGMAVTKLGQYLRYQSISTIAGAQI